MIHVIRPGDFTTIQDAGRWGYQAWGMPVSGAMDPYAYQAANWLAGNAPGAAALEFTGNGGMLHFDSGGFAALTGADMQATLNGRPVKPWSSFVLPAEGTLTLRKAVSGHRAYLAVWGGLEVPLVMGSRSTYTPAGIGGLNGRALRIGDILSVGLAAGTPPPPRVLPPRWRPAYAHEWQLAVILGPQDEWFRPAEKQKFFFSAYRLTAGADRLHYALSGPSLTVAAPDMVSAASGWGAVEVPSGGQPLIVTPDHGTTRGFAKIGYVMQADFSKLAQAVSGDCLHFVCTTVAEATTAYRRQQEQLDKLRMYVSKGQL